MQLHACQGGGLAHVGGGVIEPNLDLLGEILGEVLDPVGRRIDGLMMLTLKKCRENPALRTGCPQDDRLTETRAVHDRNNVGASGDERTHTRGMSAQMWTRSVEKNQQQLTRGSRGNGGRALEPSGLRRGNLL